MSKRVASDSTTDLESTLKNGERAGSTVKLGDAVANGNRQDGMGEFEDPFEDEFESDEEVVDAEEAEGGVGLEDDEDGEDDNEMDVDTQVYHPSRPPRPLGKDEILEPDPSAYDMFHTVNVKWPSLSFDILPDKLGDDRRSYPATVYLVTGSQASRARENELTVIKLSGLSKMKQLEGDSDDEEDEADDEDDDPILESRHIPMNSTTNRIRLNPHARTTNEYIAATMLESGEVNLYDVTAHLTSLDTPGSIIPPASNKPLQTLRMHGRTEGYAIDWSPLIPQGRLLTGDNDGKIFQTTRNEAGSFVPDASPFTGHTSSIEELQWSPAEKTVFASASADGTVKIWDTRAKRNKPAISVDVSSSDVNVASWHPTAAHQLATGADDGVWAVWDLRMFQASSNVSPVASFTWHQQAITSIEWCSSEESVVAVASADNTITLWDLAVEEDAEETGGKENGVEDVPDQLLFVHVMEGVKEVHWMKQMPGVVVGTGADGFGVFKTISV